MKSEWPAERRKHRETPIRSAATTLPSRRGTAAACHVETLRLGCESGSCLPRFITDRTGGRQPVSRLVAHKSNRAVLYSAHPQRYAHTVPSQWTTWTSILAAAAAAAATLAATFAGLT